jgi:hypothetical protein
MRFYGETLGLEVTTMELGPEVTTMEMGGMNLLEQE